MTLAKLPDFEAWVIFSVVAEERSFAGAAQKLGLSRPTISRAIARLEAEIGVTLLQRTSHQIALTQAGQEAQDYARKLYDDGQALEAVMKEQDGPLRGLIRMSLPASFATYHMAPLLAEFMDKYPLITIEADCEDKRVDLVSGKYDLAVRISALVDSSLKVRQVCKMPRFLVASPQWVKQHSPIAPRALEHHMSVIYTTSRNSTSSTIHLHEDGGQDLVLNLNKVRFYSNNAEIFVPFLEGGNGVGLLPLFMIEESLRNKKLEIILPEWRAEEIFLHILTPPLARRPARVDVFINWLACRLKKVTWYQL